MTGRGLAATLLAALLTMGCVPEDVAVTTPPPEITPVDPAVYAARNDGGRMLAAIDVAAFHPALLRNRVPYATTEAPGTIVIDTKGPFLYLVEPDGMATRYGIAVGREGFGWTGAGYVARTARWPGWTPPPEMIARDPSLAKWAGGMPGGPQNPLGARALYIYFDGHDSGYRIHGTNQPKSIGWAASSGCFRMLNQDVIDLYERVETGARVVVI
ncbi:L,D-transpeptidase [Amaricoccus sp.]|uniref:L,D-transpeptidase n=1 Tax=Amaricoccus sp. TaxID=1872485 RepID=UPI001B6B284C|nr:L,D-transpeptidase [Amaricoccus sp.]MBP7001855.1 L,D-transpeptidase [Amaricoccus sp.]